jgi:hypothetical protein
MSCPVSSFRGATWFNTISTRQSSREIPLVGPTNSNMSLVEFSHRDWMTIVATLGKRAIATLTWWTWRVETTRRVSVSSLVLTLILRTRGATAACVLPLRRSVFCHGPPSTKSGCLEKTRKNKSSPAMADKRGFLERVLVYLIEDMLPYLGGQVCSHGWMVW